MRTSLVAGIRAEAVRAPQRARPADADRDRTLLIGEWRDPQRPPTELWLTGMTSSPLAGLLRLSKLVRRVARDHREFGEPSGLGEFAGRSFQGWHRHITLASAAHTAAPLGAQR